MIHCLWAHGSVTALWCSHRISWIFVTNPWILRPSWGPCAWDCGGSVFHVHTHIQVAVVRSCGSTAVLWGHLLGGYGTACRDIMTQTSTGKGGQVFVWSYVTVCQQEKCWSVCWFTYSFCLMQSVFFTFETSELMITWTLFLLVLHYIYHRFIRWLFSGWPECQKMVKKSELKPLKKVFC